MSIDGGPVLGGRGGAGGAGWAKLVPVVAHVVGVGLGILVAIALLGRLGLPDVGQQAAGEREDAVVADQEQVDACREAVRAVEGMSDDLREAVERECERQPGQSLQSICNAAMLRATDVGQERLTAMAACAQLPA